MSASEIEDHHDLAALANQRAVAATSPSVIDTPLYGRAKEHHHPYCSEIANIFD